MKHIIRIFVMALAGMSTLAYADTAIWSLVDGITANATDRIPIARDAATNKYITPLEISTYISGTYGTGVGTALGNATNASGGLATQNGAITAGNILKGSATGVQDTGIAASALQAIIYSGQKALGTSAIASGACATVVTQAATGLATTSTVSLTYAATPVGVTGYDPSTTTGSLQVTGYPTANQVNISVCNPTSASITPAAMTVNVVAY